METIPIILLALFCLCNTEEVRKLRQRRGSFVTSFPVSSNPLRIGGIDVGSYELGLAIPFETFIQHDINYGIDLTVPIPSIGHFDLPPIPAGTSNAVDKPVDEPQEVVPPPSMGSAVIPYYPPPAVPVNAAASNVPVRMGAVFLGSGSIGVIELGGGAYAIGSGSLGYSERRSNPRASIKHPLLPPIGAAPDLIPAAVNSPEDPQVLLPRNYNIPAGAPLPTDHNGYEYLPPNRVGFGDPLPPRPIKTRQAFATPSALQVQPPLLPQNLPIIDTQLQTFPAIRTQTLPIVTQPQTPPPPVYRSRRLRQRVSGRSRYSTR